jgi:transcriptional regulator with XRE-family HTH domain
MELSRHSPSGASDRSDSSTPRNLTGSKIRSFREARGWSQSAFSAELKKIGFKISRDIIASIETQRSPVTDWQLAMFARVFAVSFDSFFPDAASLEQITAKVAAAPIETQKITTGKTNSPRSVTNSSAGWKMCELSCKSLKLVLRRD